MNDVPLVKDNKINDINTSIIAIKKQLKQLNEAVGLIDIPDMPDLSPYIKKSDIVDAVTSGDMHPVTSNAVARNNVHATRDYWSEDSNNPIDVIAVIESYADLIPSMSEDIHVRMGTRLINSPYGAGVQDCDFFFNIQKPSASNNNWIRVIAYDVRSNQMWENAKINGTWDGWYGLQRIEVAYLSNAIIGDNGCSIAYANLMFRNSVYNLYGRILNDTPIAVTEGMLIGHLEPSYYMNPIWDFPVNIHNFSMNEDYILIFYNNGDIRIFGIGNRTIALDLYIETTYVK